MEIRMMQIQTRYNYHYVYHLFDIQIAQKFIFFVVNAEQ